MNDTRTEDYGCALAVERIRFGNPIKRAQAWASRLLQLPWFAMFSLHAVCLSVNKKSSPRLATKSRCTSYRLPLKVARMQADGDNGNAAEYARLEAVVWAFHSGRSLGSRGI